MPYSLAHTKYFESFFAGCQPAALTPLPVTIVPFVFHLQPRLSEPAICDQPGGSSQVMPAVLCVLLCKMLLHFFLPFLPSFIIFRFTYSTVFAI